MFALCSPSVLILGKKIDRMGYGLPKKELWILEQIKQIRTALKTRLEKAIGEILREECHSVKT